MKAHKKTRVLACITLLAFVMEVLLPFAAIYAQPAFAQAASSPLANQPDATHTSGQRALVCTAQGFKWVQLEDLSSPESSPQASKHVSCPLCYAGSHLAKAPPPFDPFKLFIDLASPSQRSVPPRPKAVKARLLALGHFSRGPPQA